MQRSGGSQIPRRRSRRGAVWITGSYPKIPRTQDEFKYAQKLVKRLGARLAGEGNSVVCGQSDALVELCDNYRAASNTGMVSSRALMIHGQISPDVFKYYLKETPKAVLVIGGGKRTAQEVQLAHELCLPIGGFYRTGGEAASSSSRPEALWESEDHSEAVELALKWLKTVMANG